jgi:hypothetical protein
MRTPHALSPGDVSVTVEFRGPDGRRHSDARHSGLPYLAGGYNNPKKIGIIRVAP